jgi:hypothetical protein
VLYQPLVEMEGKYPAWLQANAATTSPEEMDRYRKQHGLVQQLLKVSTPLEACNSRAELTG